MTRVVIYIHPIGVCEVCGETTVFGPGCIAPYFCPNDGAPLDTHELDAGEDDADEDRD